jgi:hypothetical protein
MRKFWMHGARLRSLLVLIVGILIADTSVAESFKKQAIGFGALGSISVPTSWVKSDAKAVLPATRIQFGPPQSKFGIFVFDPASPIYSAAARNWFVTNAKITAPTDLPSDQIKILSDEMGNAGDNQYSKRNDEPLFHISSAQAISVNGKTVVKIDGAFVDETGKPRMYMVGIFTPSETPQQRMLSMYTQSTDENEFKALRAVFDETMKSIVWRK